MCFNAADLFTLNGRQSCSKFRRRLASPDAAMPLKRFGGIDRRRVESRLKRDQGPIDMCESFPQEADLPTEVVQLHVRKAAFGQIGVAQ
jgi:hypothetical protein